MSAASVSARRFLRAGGVPILLPLAVVTERPTARAHREAAAVLAEGDLAIDATAGNGHDTVFLASKVGESGRVLAFDIQPEAIASARARVGAAGFGGRVSFFEASHATMGRHAEASSVAAILFNLGYLPGGDRGVITTRDETLAALDLAVGLLRPGGILSVVCYPGHPGGDAESEAVIAWTGGLPDGYPAEIDRRYDTFRPAPFLVLVRRC